MDYLDGLNPSQRSAVLQTDGPVMIIAGAGSGKTRVLTFRIAHLLAQGVDSFNILALTFTNKAAREMKKRIEDMVGPEAKNLWMGTFHSIFAKILRLEAHRLGYPSNFTIYDTDDTKSLLSTIIKEFGLDDKTYKTSLVLNRISGAKNNLISPMAYLANDEVMAEDRMSAKPKIGEIYLEYSKRCFKAAAMDFDDLLFNTNLLLRDFPEVLNRYQHKFKYIMVDEYQDTNFSQYVIVKKLASMYENICVVGDDAQSIYAFRGANIQNILNFEKDYPDLKVFKLEQNYRSTQTIVKAANSVISKNRDQLKKNVWTDNLQGNRIRVMRAMTDNEEGVLVANQVFEVKNVQQARNGDFAILYRTNAQSRAMEEALRKLNIPYRIFGGLSFYKRREIKDLLAYFRLVINPHDEEALKRVINYPVRGIGKTSIEKMVVLAKDNDMTLWQIGEYIAGRQIDIGASTGKVGDFITMIKSFQAMAGDRNAYELGSHIATSCGLLRELYMDKTPEGVSRYDNIQELLNGMKEFTEKSIELPLDSNEITVANSLESFMADIALLTDADEEDEEKEADKVSLMTIHAAKGLEFPYVFIVGMEENLFPSQLSLNSRAELEEERRLFYVALTRAEKQAFLSYATTRYKYGSLTGSEPSRFIEEIEPEYLDMPRQAPNRGLADSPVSFQPKSNFWTGNLSKKPERPAYTPPPIPSGLKRLEPSVPSSVNYSQDNQAIQPGVEVIHEKFGQGKVMQLEGSGDSRKATIFFPSSGQKQILLKFARLKIVG
ncbi:MAG: UvrD-helicase domain-containing protein [Bacteroidia bacterium]|nr:UvrD-helicase domain-containing protein [Bacteroidia bacterium]